MALAYHSKHTWISLPPNYSYQLGFKCQSNHTVERKFTLRNLTIEMIDTNKRRNIQVQNWVSTKKSTSVGFQLFL